MADAKRCDRCGKFYTMVMISKIMPNFKVLYTTTNKRYDLGPDCQALLEEFLNNPEKPIRSTEVE